MSGAISTYPYPPRPGSSPESFQVDLQAESKLGPEEIQGVLEFEQNLFGVTLDPREFPDADAFRLEREAMGRPVPPLLSIWKKKVNNTTLGVNYFLTEKGRDELNTAVGVNIESDSPEDVRRQLSSMDIHGVPSKVLDKLQADSVGHEESQLAKAFIENDFHGDSLAAPDIATVYKNPEVILEKARGFRDIKAYLTKVKADLQIAVEQGVAVAEAKLLLTELYRRRINVFLADIYVTAHQLLAQYYASGSTAHGEVVSGLEQELAGFFVRYDNEAHAHRLQRMDRFKQGVSIDDNGEFTWLSARACELAERAEQDNIEPMAVSRGIYEDVDPELLSSIEIDGSTFGEWLSGVLDEYGYLSEHTEWSSEREGPAPDGKWQIIVDDKFKSLSVNGKQRVVKVPAKQTTLLAAVTVGSHEITHVIQHENKRRLGQFAILNSDINFDAASDQVESGGKWQEREAHEMLTGVEDRTVTGIGYLEAIKAKDRGGSYGECVEAYYNYLRQANPKLSPERAAAQAVNRARRIFRAGGLEFAQDNTYITNTQPLSYLEQQLTYESLGDEQRKLLLVGGVSIRNLVRLAEYGLVDLQKIYIPEKSPREIMHPYVKKYVTSIAQAK